MMCYEYTVLVLCMSVAATQASSGSVLDFSLLEILDPNQEVTPTPTAAPLEAAVPFTAEEWAAAKDLTATWDGQAREGAPGMFQGDIDIGDTSILSKEIQRNAVIYETYRWHYGEIPYVLSTSLTETMRVAIANAIIKYHSTTCIRFVYRTTQEDYIEFAAGPGCYSQLGRQGGHQMLYIGDSCAFSGIVQHDLMHAIGFWHEVTRPDRDQYVQINWENMNEQSKVNFEIGSSAIYTTQEMPYDYGSLLHFDATYCTNNGLATITVLNPPAEIGQRNELSSLDCEKINKLHSTSCHGRQCQGAVSDYVSLRGEILDFCINEQPEDINDRFVMSTTQFVGWTESTSVVPTNLISGTGTNSIGVHLRIDLPYENNAEDRGPVIWFNISIITTDELFRWKCTRSFSGSDWCSSYMDEPAMVGLSLIAMYLDISW